MSQTMRIALYSLVACSLVAASSVPEAHALRPTEGGIFTYDEGDVLEFWDEPTGTVRVHFSVSGPNVTVLDDEDSDGVPDYPQLVANTTAAVFDFFENSRGFRPPVREADIGLGALGGSLAFDVYLVDFRGNADGSFGIDDCQDTPVIRCAGFFSMENDFLGYSYPSLEYATNVLTSHELFHAVQAAYTVGLPVWFSEGTATWAEKQWDTDSGDFLRFTDAYMRETDRSVDRPPGGPVPAFAYGTALFFDFLTMRADHTLVVAFLDALDSTGDGVDALAFMAEVLGGADALRAEWLDFVVWNLASGPRAGIVTGYPYAEQLLGVTATGEGAAIDDENRYYPFATTYYRLEHDGGRIFFGIEEAAPELHFGLHAVADGAADGPVEDALDTWTGETANSWPVADGMDLPAGSYWLWGTKPEAAESSTRVRVCLGTEATATACAPLLPDIPPPPDPVADDGCRISSTSGAGAGPWLLVLALTLATRRRRRRSDSSSRAA